MVLLFLTLFRLSSNHSFLFFSHSFVNIFLSSTSVFFARFFIPVRFFAAKNLFKHFQTFALCVLHSRLNQALFIRPFIPFTIPANSTDFHMAFFSLSHLSPSDSSPLLSQFLRNSSSEVLVPPLGPTSV